MLAADIKTLERRLRDLADQLRERRKLQFWQETAPTTPVVLVDAGVENVNAQVDALIHAGVLPRLLAFTELKLSNSIIEAWGAPSSRALRYGGATFA